MIWNYSWILSTICFGSGVCYSITDKNGKEQTKAIKDMKQFDSRIKAYGYGLRLVISNKPKDKAQPWYIITNDFDSTRKAIIEIYYYRFEIEETFRDIKHIQSFSLVLWFVIAGVWLSFSIDEVKQQLTESLHKNMHKKLSIVRLW